MAKVCQWCSGASRDHHAVHQHPGDLHRLGRQGAALGERSTCTITRPPELWAARGDGQCLQEQGLLLHGDIAVGVAGGAAQQGHVHRPAGVEQILLPVDGHQFHDVLGGAGIELAAAVAGVDEGPEPDPREDPRTLGRHVPEPVRDHPLGQVVGLDPVAPSASRPSLGASPQ